MPQTETRRFGAQPPVDAGGWKDVDLSAAPIGEWKDVGDWKDVSTSQEKPKPAFGTPLPANIPNSNLLTRTRDAILGVSEGFGVDAGTGNEGTSPLTFSHKPWTSAMTGLRSGVKSLYDIGTTKPEELIDKVSPVAKQLVKAPYEGGKKIVQDFKDQDYNQAAYDAGKTGADLVNLGGAAEGVMQGVRRFGATDAGEAIKRGTGNAVTSVTDSASRFNRKINPLATPEFGDALTQAVKPGIYGGTGWDEAIKDPRTAQLLKEYEAKLGTPIKTLDDLEKVIRTGKQDVWNQIESANPQVRNAPIDTTEIGSAMRNSLADPITIAQNPNIVGDIDARAKAYDTPRTVKQLEDRLSVVNAELSAHYAKNNLKRWQDLATHPETAATYAEGQALRESVNKSLDPMGAGSGLAELKNRYGLLRKIEEPVIRRNVIAKQANPNSLSEQISLGRSAGEAVTGAVAGLATGDPRLAVGGALVGAGDAAITRWVRNRNAPDSLVRRAMAGARPNGAEPVRFPDVTPRDPITGEILMHPQTGPLLHGTKTKNPAFQMPEDKVADATRRDPITHEITMPLDGPWKRDEAGQVTYVGRPDASGVYNAQGAPAEKLGPNTPTEPGIHDTAPAPLHGGSGGQAIVTRGGDLSGLEPTASVPSTDVYGKGHGKAVQLGPNKAIEHGVNESNAPAPLVSGGNQPAPRTGANLSGLEPQPIHNPPPDVYGVESSRGARPAPRSNGPAQKYALVNMETDPLSGLPSRYHYKDLQTGQTVTSTVPLD